MKTNSSYLIPYLIHSCLTRFTKTFSQLSPGGLQFYVPRSAFISVSGVMMASLTDEFNIGCVTGGFKNHSISQMPHRNLVRAPI